MRREGIIRLIFILLAVSFGLLSCTKPKPMPKVTPTVALGGESATGTLTGTPIGEIATLTPSLGPETATPTPETMVTPMPSEPTPSPSAGTTYVVQAGDTVFSIARAYGVSAQAIIQANALTDPDRITPGQELIIPAAEATPAKTPPPEGRTYTVQTGDTLVAIAARFGTTVEAIMQANGLTDPSYIRVGQVLSIP